MQQTRIEQAAHNHWNATHTIHIAHHVTTEGLDVREQRHLRADAVEVLYVQVDFRFMGDRQQMQDRVGRASEGHDHRDGVLEGLPRDDVARGNAEAEQLDHGLTALACERVSATIDGRRSGRPRQRHSHRFSGTRHRVGGVHTPAGTFTRTNGSLDAVNVFSRHQASRARAHGLECIDDGDVLLRTVAQLHVAGKDGAGVHEHRRHVESSRRHQHARQRLIAPSEGHHAVESFRFDNRLD